jgi:hypothetical protein
VERKARKAVLQLKVDVNITALLAPNSKLHNPKEVRVSVLFVLA